MLHKIRQIRAFSYFGEMLRRRGAAARMKPLYRHSHSHMHTHTEQIASKTQMYIVYVNVDECRFSSAISDSSGKVSLPKANPMGSVR